MFSFSPEIVETCIVAAGVFLVAAFAMVAAATAAALVQSVVEVVRERSRAVVVPISDASWAALMTIATLAIAMAVAIATPFAARGLENVFARALESVAPTIADLADVMKILLLIVGACAFLIFTIFGIGVVAAASVVFVGVGTVSLLLIAVMDYYGLTPIITQLVRMASSIVTEVAALPARRWLEAASPFLAYWGACAFYTLARGGDRDVTYERNTVSRSRVLWFIARLNASSLLGNIVAFTVFEARGRVDALRPLHVLAGLFCIDTLEYFMHRLYHLPWLYVRFHKQHHALHSPYSYAALYNHWSEATLTSLVIGATLFWGVRASWYEFLLTTSLGFIAAVRQHTYLGSENDYHWIHHAVDQTSNFAQPFTDVWDRLLGTMYNPNVAASVAIGKALASKQAWLDDRRDGSDAAEQQEEHVPPAAEPRVGVRTRAMRRR